MFKFAAKRAIFLTLILLSMLIACSSHQTTGPTSTGTAPSSTGTLNVAFNAWPGFSGQYVAMAKDFFKAEGVDVKENFFPVISDADTAFLARRVDIELTTAASLVTMASRDPSIKVIMLMDYSNGSDGIVGRDITKPEDVKGKNVARENQLFENILLQSYLQKGGLTLKDVSLTDTPAQSAASAFIAKKVDAAVSYEPWLTKAANQGDGKVIFSTKGTNIISDVMVTRTKVIQEHKSELLAYLRSIDKAVKLVNAGSEDAINIVAKKLNVTPAEAKEQIAGVRIFDIAGNKTIGFNPSNQLNVINNLQFSAQVAQELKVTPNLVDTNALLDDSLVKSL